MALGFRFQIPELSNHYALSENRLLWPTRKEPFADEEAQELLWKTSEAFAAFFGCGRGVGFWIWAVGLGDIGLHIRGVRIRA